MRASALHALLQHELSPVFHRELRARGIKILTVISFYLFTPTRSFIDLFIEWLLKINIVMTVNMISEGFHMPNWREHDVKGEVFVYGSKDLT